MIGRGKDRKKAAARGAGPSMQPNSSETSSGSTGTDPVGVDPKQRSGSTTSVATVVPEDDLSTPVSRQQTDKSDDVSNALDNLSIDNGEESAVTEGYLLRSRQVHRSGGLVPNPVKRDLEPRQSRHASPQEERVHLDPHAPSYATDAGISRDSSAVLSPTTDSTSNAVPFSLTASSAETSRSGSVSEHHAQRSDTSSSSAHSDELPDALPNNPTDVQALIEQIRRTQLEIEEAVREREEAKKATEAANRRADEQAEENRRLKEEKGPSTVQECREDLDKLLLDILPSKEAVDKATNLGDPRPGKRLPPSMAYDTKSVDLTRLVTSLLREVLGEDSVVDFAKSDMETAQRSIQDELVGENEYTFIWFQYIARLAPRIVIALADKYRQYVESPEGFSAAQAHCFDELTQSLHGLRDKNNWPSSDTHLTVRLALSDEKLKRDIWNRIKTKTEIIGEEEAQAFDPNTDPKKPDTTKTMTSKHKSDVYVTFRRSDACTRIASITELKAFHVKQSKVLWQFFNGLQEDAKKAEQELIDRDPRGPVDLGHQESIEHIPQGSIGRQGYSYPHAPANQRTAVISQLYSYTLSEGFPLAVLNTGLFYLFLRTCFKTGQCYFFCNYAEPRGKQPIPASSNSGNTTETTGSENGPWDLDLLSCLVAVLLQGVNDAIEMEPAMRAEEAAERWCKTKSNEYYNLTKRKGKATTRTSATSARKGSGSARRSDDNDPGGSNDGGNGGEGGADGGNSGGGGDSGGNSGGGGNSGETSGGRGSDGRSGASPGGKARGVSNFGSCDVNADPYVSLKADTGAMFYVSDFHETDRSEPLDNTTILGSLRDSNGVGDVQDYGSSCSTGGASSSSLSDVIFDTGNRFVASTGSANSSTTPSSEGKDGSKAGEHRDRTMLPRRVPYPGRSESLITALFCSEKCLQSLRHGLVLDPLCPNFELHGGDEMSSQAQTHNITVEQVVKDLEDKLHEAEIEHIMEPILGCRGASAQLFRIVHPELGYAFAAKGVNNVRTEFLELEAAVYEHIWNTAKHQPDRMFEGYPLLSTFFPATGGDESAFSPSKTLQLDPIRVQVPISFGVIKPKEENLAVMYPWWPIDEVPETQNAICCNTFLLLSYHGESLLDYGTFKHTCDMLKLLSRGNDRLHKDPFRVLAAECNSALERFGVSHDDIHERNMLWSHRRNSIFVIDYGESRIMRRDVKV